jgi:hypothetical protein
VASDICQALAVASGWSASASPSASFVAADAPAPPALPGWVAALSAPTNRAAGSATAAAAAAAAVVAADARALAALPAAGWLQLPVFISSSFADPAHAKEHALLTHTILPAVRNGILLATS